MKNRLSLVGLYTGFFGLSFALCLFFTFDARVLASALEGAARQGNVKLSYGQAKMSGLAGLEMGEVEISRLDRPEARPFTLRRLVLSPALSSLPGMLLDLRKKRTPRLGFSFSGWLDEGQRNIGGRVKMMPPGMEIDLDLANLPIDQLGAGLIPNFPPLSGKLNSKVRLELKDRLKPATWNGTVSADLFSAQLAEFTLSQVMKIPGFSLGNANLNLELTGGKGPLKSLRLQGGDLGADFTGSVALPEAGLNNLGDIRVELTGTLSMTDDNKQKLPLIASIVPPNGQFKYSGELKAISPMMQTGAISAPGPAPGAARGGAPDAVPDPMINDLP